jgi:hypothetical protein
MDRFFGRIMKVVGFYRLADVVYSIWSGKSLLALVIISGASTFIARYAKGFAWSDLDSTVLIAAAIYAALALGWLATIIIYREISPKHKLVIPEFDFRCDPVAGSNPLQATAFQAAVNLKNIAEFPLSYLVQQIDFRVQNTMGGGQLANQGATIDARQVGTFSSALVVFHQPIALPIEGRLDIKILYGKLGAEKFEKEASVRVTYRADPRTTSGVRHDWTYAR